MAVVETKPVSGEATVQLPLPVFVHGVYTPTCNIVEPSSDSNSPPKPLFIVGPKEPGTYNVILFFHGTSLTNQSYSQLFQHIASHGFIVCSPQLYKLMPPSGNTEVEHAADVTNWLIQGLQPFLPGNVKPNFSFLAVSGHSRGGLIAFALALGYAKNLEVGIKFSALVGVDPVAGIAKCAELDPPILAHDPFNFLSSSMPVTVIGTGLGGVAKLIIPCAPEWANYEKFFNRCTSTRAQFVAKEYGHMDVLDDHPSGFPSRLISSCMCTNGKHERDPMRRCVGGIIVAFLKKYSDPNSIDNDFIAIVQHPSAAPIMLDSVKFIEG